jgi:hypothetical protein
MRLTLSFVPVAAIALTLLAAGPAPAQSANAGNLVPIHGTVASVDRQNFTVDLRFASPGSEPVTRRTFALVDHNDVLRLVTGAVVDATADTTQKVWTLSNVNVESDKPLKGQVGP